MMDIDTPPTSSSSSSSSPSPSLYQSPETNGHGPSSSKISQPASSIAITNIHSLNALDSAIPAILTSASLAIRALTQSPPSPSASSGAPTAPSTSTDSTQAATLEDRKVLFTNHTTAFYTHIQALSAQLRRHAYLLEEAGLTSPDTIDTTSSNTTSSFAAGAPAAAGPGSRAPQSSSASPPQAIALARQTQTSALSSGARGPGGPGGPGGNGPGGLQEPPVPITNGGLGNLDVGWLNSRRDRVGVRKEGELWTEAKAMLEGILAERGDGLGIEKQRNEDDDMDVGNDKKEDERHE